MIESDKNNGAYQTRKFEAARKEIVDSILKQLGGYCIPKRNEVIEHFSSSLENNYLKRILTSTTRS